MPMYLLKYTQIRQYSEYFLLGDSTFQLKYLKNVRWDWVLRNMNICNAKLLIFALEYQQKFPSSAAAWTTLIKHGIWSLRTQTCSGTSSATNPRRSLVTRCYICSMCTTVNLGLMTELMRMYPFLGGSAFCSQLKVIKIVYKLGWYIWACE